MERYSFKKIIALVLSIVLIFQNSVLTYGARFETEQVGLYGTDTYGENISTTGTAIKTSTASAIQQSMSTAMADIDYDISWYTGDEEPNYVIINAAQLKGFAHLTNGTAINATSGTAIESKTFSGKTITIDKDIDLKSEEWIPIGMSSSKKFEGTFDGGNNTISGIYIKNDSNYQGLFGYAGNNALIKNLKVEGNIEYTGTSTSSYSAGLVAYGDNCKIEKVTASVSVNNPKGYAAGIIAYAQPVELKDCSNEGNIEGNYAGSIGGYFTNSSKVENCSNSGVITGVGYTGGIVGYLYTGQITDCTNKGTITGIDYVGGIVGRSGAVTINRCTNTGSVEGTDSNAYIGGVLGYSSSAITITNCFVKSDIIGANTNYIGGIAGYCSSSSATIRGCVYYNETNPMSIVGLRSSVAPITCFYISDKAVEGYKGYAKDADSFKHGEVTYLLNKASGSDKVNWEQGEEYPVLSDDAKGLFRFKIAPLSVISVVTANVTEPEGSKIFTDKIGAQSIYLNEGEIEFTFSNIEDKEVLILQSIPKNAITEKEDGIYSVEIISEDVTILYGLKSEPSGADINWYIPEQSHYELSQASELMGFSVLVNGETPYGAVDFSGKTIKLNNDISLQEEWAPIGGQSTPFKGVFDGNSKTIGGLDINNTDTEKMHQGFFGYSEGQINNLTITGTAISAGDYVGGIVGYSKGEINNCKFGISDESTKSSVTGNNYVGGIAGYSESPVYSSFNYASVTGAGSNIGGIAGRITGIIGASGKGNKNYGEITGQEDYVGGIAGYANSHIRYNENHGEVFGNGNYAGGIAGRGNSQTEYNKNYAYVEGSKDFVGGIVGYGNNAVRYNENKAAVNNLEGNYTGGIAGRAFGYTIGTGNINSGNVSSKGDYTGGIFGYSGPDMRNNVNEGNISSEGNYVGGWTGYTEGGIVGEKDKFSIKNAEIKGNLYVGAIAGRNGHNSNSNMQLVSADSNTKVSGNNYVGGLTGYIRGNMSNSYSLATVSTTGTAILGGLTGTGYEGSKIINSFYYNNELSILSGSNDVAIENSYCLAVDDYSDIRKSAELFSSGEIAWLLGGGSGTRNTNWTQDGEEAHPKLGSYPVFKVKLTEEQAIEGNSIEEGSGTYGPAIKEIIENPDATTGSAITSWYTYVKSNDNMEIRVTLTEGREFLLAPPIEMEKNDSIYSFKVSANYDGIYSFGITVAPTYVWYTEGSDPYTIKEESDLVGLANLVNGEDFDNSNQEGPINFEGKTIFLDDDIPMVSGNWTPIGRVDTPFKGNFNAQNNTITGLKISSINNDQGLFGYITNAKIENLTVCGNVYGTGNNTGGVVGRADGVSNFENVHFGTNDSASSVSGKDNTGGIIGYIGGASSVENITVKSCNNYAAITGNVNTGGIIGYISGVASQKDTITVEASVNNAAVKGNGNNAGGLIGRSDNTDVNVIDCQNNSDISTDTQYAQYAGGIIGYHGASQNTGKIVGCINDGNIRSNSNNVGGIAAYVFGNMDISGCSNKGEIKGNMYSGGIVGNAGSNVSITDSNNEGIVEGTSRSAGISGYFSGKNLIGNYNTGQISGSGSSGGIVGQFSGSKLSNCYNTGEVAITGSGAGGIAGVIDKTFDGTAFMTTYCFNTGKISGSSNIGGIVGQNTSDWPFGGDPETVSGVKFSYNTGKINVSSGKPGAISGAYFDLDNNNICIDSDMDHVDANRVTYMSESQFASGEASYYLDNGDRGDNRSIIWSLDKEKNIPIFADSENHPVYKITIMPTVGGKINSSNEVNNIYGTAGTDISLNIAEEDGKILKLIKVINKQTDEVIFSDSNKETIVFKVPNADVNVDALFVEKGTELSYSVEFISDEASYISQTVANGGKAGEPSEPSKAGYEFMGWYTDSGSKWDFNTAITENITLYAKWKTEGAVIITFNSNGGTFKDGKEILTLEVEKGETIPFPEEPTNGMLEFKGWYTTKTNNIKLTSNTEAEKDSKYFAQWIQIGEFYPGSPEEPYLIKSEAELISLADQVNDGDTFKGYYFQLSDHTDKYYLSDWTGIGGGSKYFEGNFDGNGVTISFNGSSGLFGSLRDAVVENITVDVDIEGGEQTGGIANYAYARNSQVTIKDVIVKGEISGTSQVGGIVGRGYADYGAPAYKYPVYIENCINEADVYGSSDYVGGIIGLYFTDNHINNATNNGNVTGGGDATGGIAGYAVYGKFESCSNAGIIEGKNYTGGLVGSIGTMDINDHASGNFISCYNAGNVSGTSNVGGLLGGPGAYDMTGNTTGRFTNFEDCYNTGSITASGNYAGGIAGQTNPSQSGTSNHAYNTGNIYGANYVAGLFGSRTNAESAVNCYNMGIITATGPNIGAISGNTNGSTTDCYNSSSSIENPIDIADITILEEESFKNGHAAYLLDGGKGATSPENFANRLLEQDEEDERLYYWTQGDEHPVKGIPEYYKINLETDVDGGSIDIDGLSEVYKGKGEEITINLTVSEPETVVEEGVGKEYKYVLESLTVTQNGEKTDITEDRKFDVLDDALVEVRFERTEVTEDPEEPEEPKKPDKPYKPEKPEKPEKQKDEDDEVKSGDGEGEDDGPGTGDGTDGDGSTESGNEPGYEYSDSQQKDGNEGNTGTPSDIIETKEESAPVLSEIPIDEEPEPEILEENLNEIDDTENEPEKPEEPEDTEEVIASAVDNKRNILPPVLVAIVAGLLIVAGVFRYITIKRKK